MYSSLSINGAKKKREWRTNNDNYEIILMPSTSSKVKARRSFKPHLEQMDNQTELSRDNDDDVVMDNVCHNHHPDYRSTTTSIVANGIQFNSSIIAKYCSSSSMLSCRNISNSHHHCGQSQSSSTTAKHQRRPNSHWTMLSSSSVIILAIIVSLMMNCSVNGGLVHGQHETKKGIFLYI